ncbi:hypothetical protein [Mycobacterium haemophilum]|uniref:hypothetical protein n=1 Tax=Mycobacterium haemophilum TaxID=29311 RepID=UPI000ACE38B0|nr:hypothetical protein [Mycobacterium haemophilum]
MTQADGSNSRLAELARENQLLREQYEGALAEIDALKRDVEALHDIGVYNYRQSAGKRGRLP